MIIALVISTLFNIFFIWYIYYLLKKLLFVSENTGEFLDILKDFSEHVNAVYNMENYYGDETIEHLLEHSKQIVKEIKAYEDIYDITYIEEEMSQEEEVTQEEE